MAALGSNAFADVEGSAEVYFQVPQRFADPVAGSATESLNDASHQAHAFAEADLASGLMRVSNSAQSSIPCFGFCGLASSTGHIKDILTLQGPGTLVPVTFQMAVDGTFSMSGNTGGSISNNISAFISVDPVGENIYGSNLSLTRFYQVDGNGVVFNNVLNGTITGSPGSVLTKTLDSASALLVASGTINVGQPFIFEARLGAGITGGAPNLLASADFAHTAAISLILPDGYSFTSSSGQFLSAVPMPPVPEPSTCLLMLGGIGFIAARRRYGRPSPPPESRARQSCTP